MSAAGIRCETCGEVFPPISFYSRGHLARCPLPSKDVDLSPDDAARAGDILDDAMGLPDPMDLPAYDDPDAPTLGEMVDRAERDRDAAEDR